MKKPKPVWIIVNRKTGEPDRHFPYNTYRLTRAEAEELCGALGQAVQYVPATAKKRKQRKAKR